MRRDTDLVRDSKLRTTIRDGITRHIIETSDQSGGRRKIKREERWQRVGDVLGEGAFGIVWKEELVQGESETKIRAVKRIQKRLGRSMDVEYSRELEAIAKFSRGRYQPFFVQSYGWFESQDHVFITMEYFEHGDLHKYMQHVGPMPEEDVRSISHQILEGVKEMHDNDFAHRDLKPSNVLIRRTKDHESGWWVKIGDFGISKRAEEGMTALRTIGGTEGFLAPEILVRKGYLFLEPTIESKMLGDKREYTFVIDIWAVGEIIYRALCNESPFRTNLGAYANGRIDFPIGKLKELGISSAGTELIQQLMRVFPHERLTAFQALEQPWFEEFQNRSPRSSGEFESVDEKYATPSSLMLSTHGAKPSGSSSLDATGTVPWTDIGEMTTLRPMDTSGEVSPAPKDLPTQVSKTLKSQETSKTATPSPAARTDVKPPLIPNGLPSQVLPQTGPQGSSEDTIIVPVIQTNGMAPFSASKDFSEQSSIEDECQEFPKITSKLPLQSNVLPMRRASESQLDARYPIQKGGTGQVELPGATSPQDHTPSNPAKHLVFGHPAEFYKRLEEERQRECAVFIESSRSSPDSMAHAKDDAPSESGLDKLGKRTQKGYGRHPAAIIASIDAEDLFWQPRSKRNSIAGLVSQLNSFEIGEPSISQSSAPRVSAIQPDSRVVNNKGIRRSNKVRETSERVTSMFSSRQPSYDDHFTPFPNQTSSKLEKSYPPTSMPGAIADDEQPRQSHEPSRRASFGFSRKFIDEPANTKSTGRFSPRPSSLSRTFSSSSHRESMVADSIPPLTDSNFYQQTQETQFKNTSGLDFVHTEEENRSVYQQSNLPLPSSPKKDSQTSQFLQRLPPEFFLNTPTAFDEESRSVYQQSNLSRPSSPKMESRTSRFFERRRLAPAFFLNTPTASDEDEFSYNEIEPGDWRLRRYESFRY